MSTHKYACHRYPVSHDNTHIYTEVHMPVQCTCIYMKGEGRDEQARSPLCMYLLMTLNPPSIQFSVFQQFFRMHPLRRYMRLARVRITTIATGGGVGWWACRSPGANGVLFLSFR